MTDNPLLKLGTRGSPLALAQTRQVAEALARATPGLARPGAIEIVQIRTTGDRIQNRTLADQGGKGLFIKEIEETLSFGLIDVGVHSAKDMPSILPDDMTIGCVLPRADPRDAFFSRSGASLMELPQGSVVGTASPRRQAMVLNLRPDLKVVLLRGNIETRLAKLAAGEVDATLLAVAGLDRLGMADRITEYLDPAQIVPAAGQGTIALEIRTGDLRVRDLVAPATCADSHLMLEAERSVVTALNGSCNSPIAAWARIEGKVFKLDALAAKLDGSVIHRIARSGNLSDALAIGRDAGQSLAGMLPSGFFPQ